MNKRLALVMVLLSVVVLCVPIIPEAFARPSDFNKTSKLSEGYGPAYGMGSGMMGGRMMGPGMMGQPYNESGTAPVRVNPERSKALLAYIHDQRLPCLQCHVVSGGGLGPPFDAVSANYANRRDASSILEDHIAHGIGRMPAGLASESQATQLARLILSLRTRP